MAKLRTNHQRAKDGGSTMVRVGLFSAILAGLFYLFNVFMGKTDDTGESASNQDNYAAEEFFLPKASGQLVEHEYYALSYNEKHEQADWVAYILTKEELNMPWQERSDHFLPDDAVKTGSATPDDYRNSGYDRGHLLPAADRAFNQEAMQETFLMSNISPQAKNFNKGIWRELEELTRDWAKKNERLYVVTGPVLSQPVKGAIGENEVSVPAAYYKVLLDLAEPSQKGIGFVIPNEVSFDPLYKFAMSIDEVEEITGINFFPELMPEDLETKVESTHNLDFWEFNKKKYELRIQKWNRQQ